MSLRQTIQQSKFFRQVIRPAFRGGLRLLPLQDHLRDYDRNRRIADLKAGLNVALLAFPQAMAFSLIVGVPIQYGVAAAVVGALVGPIFASSRLVVFGPTNAAAILCLSVFINLGLNPAERVVALPALLAMAGLFLVVGAWFRVAGLIQFISRPVIVGYLTAAVILVTASQLRFILGLDLPEAASLFGMLGLVAAHLMEVQWPSVLLALVAVVLYFVLLRWFPLFPNLFISLILTSLLGWALGKAGYDFAFVSRTLGEEAVPGLQGLDFSLVSRLAGAALAVALLTFLETNSVSRSVSARTGELSDGNQQMFALGMANLASSLFAAIPVSASWNRSLYNLLRGGATPVAAIVSAVACGGLFVLLFPLLPHLPLPALAALVPVIAFSLVNRHAYSVIVRASRADLTVLLATLLAGLLFPLATAIFLGAGLSILFFLRKVGVPELEEYTITGEGQLTQLGPEGKRIPDISIVHVEGDLFFGASDLFLDQTRRLCEDPNLKVIILRLKNAHHLDASSAMAISELLRFAREKGRHLIVSGAHREIYRIFRNSGLLDAIGRDNFFMDVPSNPTLSTRNALRRARELLGAEKANIRIFAKNPDEPAGAAGGA